MAYIGVSPSNGVRQKHTYTATANQTSFSGAGAEGISLSYLDSNYVDVYQNGVKLSEADYTSTTGTTVVLATGATVSDMIEIIVYDVFSVADTVSKADGGQFDGNVAMAGTLGVTGETTLATHLNLGDNDKIKLGASGDLEIFHDGTNSNLKDTGTGSLNLIASTKVQVQGVNGETMAIFNEDGSAELRHNDVKKFETTSSGVTVTGDIANASGDLTVDVAGDIILDADDRDIKLQDGGTDWGLLQRDTSTTTSSFVVKAMKNDSDLKLRGVDNNSEITALTLDMSENGRASFNSHVDMTNHTLIFSSMGSGVKCIQTTASGSHSYTAAFFRNSSGTEVGSIGVTTSGSSFNTSSDYRLKENVNYSFDATTRLKQLKPARFNFIIDADKTVDGFLAHEVSSIVPEAVTGEKDATEDIKDVVLKADGTVLADNISENKWTEGKATVDENGDAIDPIYASDTTWVASQTVPKYQGIDQAKLVPLLVKSLQEALTEIDTLKTKVAALENA